MSKDNWKIPYLTVTGREFDLWNVGPLDICLWDIAHGCAKECRFGNQIEPHYSVAEHQIHVASLVENNFASWAHLHDAAEGLGLRDMPGPIKHWDGMLAYRTLEDRVQTAIWGAFRLHLPPDLMAEHMRVVKAADKQMYLAENEQLRKRKTPEGKSAPDVKLQCWDADEARERYIRAVAAPFLVPSRTVGGEHGLPPVFDERSLKVLGL